MVGSLAQRTLPVIVSRAMQSSTVCKLFAHVTLCFLSGGLAVLHAQQVTFNVRDYGATGARDQDAQTAIQKTIDACAHSGGGTVDFPAGDYTSGGIHLRSHVRVYLEPGATIWASKDQHTYAETDPSHGGALFYGEDLENVTLEGRGTVDGQAEYDWRLGDLKSPILSPNGRLWQAAGIALMRTYPKQSYPRLVLLIRCKNVRIAGLSFFHGGSYNLVPFDCEHVVIDAVTIRDSITEGVWADGIDPNGCKDLHISNCTIETGDDAIVLWSNDILGRAMPLENVTITNCRLSSASSALKFCDGNQVAIRNVTVTNVVITNSNRGIAFMDFDGGLVSDVVISNVTIDCNRKDWFWWGDGDPIHFNLKRESQVRGTSKDHEPPTGSIRNVILQNIIARGPGTSLISGTSDSWLKSITLDNVKIFVTAQSSSPLETTSDAMKIEWVQDLTLRNFQVIWDTPTSKKWTSALHLDHAKDVDFDNVQVRQAPTSPESAAVVLEHADGIVIRNSRTETGTGTFLEARGPESRNVEFFANDLRSAQAAFKTTGGASPSQIKLFYTLVSKPR